VSPCCCFCLCQSKLLCLLWIVWRSCSRWWWLLVLAYRDGRLCCLLLIICNFSTMAVTSAVVDGHYATFVICEVRLDTSRAHNHKNRKPRSFVYWNH
jgi:hypothetical protein